MRNGCARTFTRLLAARPPARSLARLLACRLPRREQVEQLSGVPKSSVQFSIDQNNNRDSKRTAACQQRSSPVEGGWLIVPRARVRVGKREAIGA